MFDLSSIQKCIAEAGVDGWLLCDFRGSNVLARRVLDMGNHPITSRRFYYFIPTKGEPQKLVHAIEPGVLNHLPGETNIYLRWQELEKSLATILAGSETIAMEYSPRNANPYVSRVDAGTAELVRDSGVLLVSSGDLIQQFEATWSDAQWEMHRRAAVHTRSAYDRAFGFIAERIRGQQEVRESQVQQVIMDHFQENHLTTDHPPIVAVGPHSADPHYATTPETDTPIRAGDFVLIDLWAKCQEPNSVYSDLTRVGFAGREIPEKIKRVFKVVAAARDAAIQTVQKAFASKKNLQGWEVDQAARSVISASEFADRFIHRTGHSIGQETHGNGANMDNFETHEDRHVMRRTCFSVEPGIYLPGEFGVRSEVNVYIDAAGSVHVTGGDPQQEVLSIQ